MFKKSYIRNENISKRIKNKIIIPKFLVNIYDKKIILKFGELETFFVYLFVKLFMVLFGRAKMIRFVGYIKLR